MPGATMFAIVIAGSLGLGAVLVVVGVRRTTRHEAPSGGRVVVAAVVWVRRLGTPGVELPTTALALGFTLVVAMVTGELLRRFQLPRLTGYLLFGVLIGPYLGNVITEPMARQLQTINGIATALIAFIAGLTLNFERHRPAHRAA